MYHIKASIKGVAPLAFNRPSDTLRESIESGKAGGRRSVAQSQQEAEDRVYKNGAGLYIPWRMLKKCLLEGCTLANLKYQRRSLYPYLDGAVLLLEKEIPIGKEERDFVYERWGRIPPRTGALAILRTPAVNSGWEAVFTLVVGDDGINSDQVRLALAAGGTLKGIGNNRPEFGRFEVVGWTIIQGVPSA
jgi:hypothetical protein